MKQKLTNASIAIASLITGAGLSLHIAYAQVASAPPPGTGIVSMFGIPSFLDLVNTFLSYIMNALLTVAAWLVGVAGTLLNVSMILTLHIKDFVNATPAIYQVWEAIRDISGMFIIFFLLYAAIRMILGFNAGFGDLIKNIVIAGVLINFSFFFAGLAIDASNVVSIAIYNAITASGKAGSELTISQAWNTQGGLSQLAQSAFADGGLSNIFMQSLHINNLYDSSNLSSQGAGAVISQPFKIILIGVTGIIIMITAALSFAAASLAFVLRLVILLLLLAFSPIWFAAAIVPDLKEYSKKWVNQFKAMLIFMPVYLLLMYAALAILNGSSIFNSGASTNLFQGNLGAAGAFTPINFIMIAINATIVIIMLNVPLVAAVSLGGSAAEWIDLKKIGAQGIWRNAGARTIGRAAYSLNESAAVRNLNASSPLLGGLASSGLSKVASTGFGEKKAGYTDMLKAKNKAREAQHKFIGTIDRANYATDDAFKAAQDQAKGFQAKYRDNLPWKNSVLGFMLDNRANLQSQGKLNKDSEKKAKLENMDKAVKDLRKVNQILDNLQGNEKSDETEMQSLLSEVGKSARVNEARKSLGLESLTGGAEQRLQEIQKIREDKKAAIKSWKEVAENLRTVISEGTDVKNEEKDAKIMDKLEALEKKGEGGGDKGGDKK